MLGEKLSHTWLYCVRKCDFSRSSIKEIKKHNVKSKNTGKGILIVLKINLKLSNILNKYREKLKSSILKLMLTSAKYFFNYFF